MTDAKHVPLSELSPAPQLSGEDALAEAQRFFDVMATRHTIRDFSEEPVDRALIEKAIETAGRAPNGANHQPWFFAVVESREVKRAIREAAEEEERAFYGGKAGEEWLDALAPIGTDAEKPFLETAPYLIVCFSQKRGGVEAGDDRKNYYVTESVGLACGFLLCALHQAGLATLTHTPNPMKFLNEALDRPATEKAMMIIVVGKPAEGATVPEHALKKKPLSEIMKVY
ncbi:nitroreductase family protein [Parvularcula sp. ZS-1/3]|uniref:Nitroreductase family protein n=1 Tax=Parvularcula mediterranea TaxID=2732508 RepID=A0A7Y3RP60_9PROT|nr:nitroreductase family protein [Parvularcula mediterranea]NNU17702.1 nitroreductase family protein [Parvularcula mediterranea]